MCVAIGWPFSPDDEDPVLEKVHAGVEIVVEPRLMQMGLFAAEICEVEREGVRYVLRRKRAPFVSDELVQRRS